MTESFAMDPGHAALRALERYGLVLSTQGLREIGKKLKQRKSALLSKQSDGLERHAVLVENRAMIAVFDPKSSTIVTFLPREAAMPRRAR